MVEAGPGSALSIDGILETKQTNLRFIPLYPALTAKISLIWRKIRFFPQLLHYF